eukprot:756301-Hanusia_phi.AAC.1
MLTVAPRGRTNLQICVRLVSSLRAGGEEQEGTNLGGYTVPLAAEDGDGPDKQSRAPWGGGEGEGRWKTGGEDEMGGASGNEAIQCGRGRVSAESSS